MIIWTPPSSDWRSMHYQLSYSELAAELGHIHVTRPSSDQPVDDLPTVSYREIIGELETWVMY